MEDRRGISGGRIAAGGGIIAVILVLANMFLGDGNVDLSQITDQLQQQGTTQTQLTPEQQALEDERAAFVKVVLADTEDVWSKIFSENKSTYKEPMLVLFRDQTESACGSASSAIGPFYCPGDSKVYIDLAFAEELKNRFGATGDFALAYVIAHEVGHHVQNLLGTSAKVSRLRNQLSETEYNKYSVKLELQADFYAGVWAHYDQKMKNVLVESDLEEALNAARAVGDDNIQKQATGVVRPDAFTHGTSAQRMYWFKKGFETGDINQGDTFNSDR